MVSRPDLGQVEHVLVVATNPADAAEAGEAALGPGGALADLGDGIPVEMVLATDGELPTGPAPTAPVRRLGLPEGDLAGHRDELTTALVTLVRGPGTLLVVPAREDGHPGREAVARAAATAAWRTDAVLVWMSTGDRPGAAALEVVPVDGQESPFEELHDSVEDPWAVRTSDYERRKRELTLTVLPHERYAVALEVGCSIGVLAADLTARCDHVVGVDESPQAVEAAQEEIGGRGAHPCQQLPTALGGRCPVGPGLADHEPASRPNQGAAEARWTSCLADDIPSHPRTAKVARWLSSSTSRWSSTKVQ